MLAGKASGPLATTVYFAGSASGVTLNNPGRFPGAVCAAW